MTARLFRAVAIFSATSALAACAGLGGTGVGGAGGAERPTLPVVTDPAPIVSGTMRPYQIRGRWYQPAEQPDYDEVGLASWYGDQFHGRPTATGERFDMNQLTAAHKTLPLPGLVEVTNLANGRSVVLRVNDRGPFVDGRIIDLSRGAADALDLRRAGVGQVRVRYLGRAPRQGGGQVMAAGTGPVPTPAPLLPATVTPASALQSTVVGGEGGAFWVQAGAYSERRAADRVSRRLGDRAQVQDVQTGAGRLYRVVVGPWDDAGAAERARQAVIARGHADALLISGR